MNREWHADLLKTKNQTTTDVFEVKMQQTMYAWCF